MEGRIYGIGIHHEPLTDVLAITAVVAVHLFVQSKPSSVHLGLGFMADVQRASVKLRSKGRDFGLDEGDDFVSDGIYDFPKEVAFCCGGVFGLISQGEVDFAVVTF